MRSSATIEEYGLFPGSLAISGNTFDVHLLCDGIDVVDLDTFKLRAGMPIGAKVTLRGDRMWEFLDRLIATAIPRIRDFRGVKATSFDGHGNFSMGVTEQLIFPEIDYDKIDRTRGMDITVVTTAENDEQAYALLKALGFPFKARGQQQ